MKLATTQIYSIKSIWLRSALPLACKNFLTPLTTEFSELAKVQLIMYREAADGVGKSLVVCKRLQVCANTLRVDVGQK